MKKALLYFVVLVIEGLRWTSCIIHENLCEQNADLIQCKLLDYLNNQITPIYFFCDPIDKKNCKVFDVIDDRIASCELKYNSYQGGLLKTRASCHPTYDKYMNTYEETRISVPHGDPICVPVVYPKRFRCGDRGSRCVCGSDHHQCYCQWFLDYCSIADACENPGSCLATVEGLQCIDSSINQCNLNPALCQDQDSYCVDIPDAQMTWNYGSELEGEGFGCVKKNVFQKLVQSTRYCNFNRTDHILSGYGFRFPYNEIDYCCYGHLICIEKTDKIGGFLFKIRPCYCNVEFRKCLTNAAYNRQFAPSALLMISLLDKIKLCTQDDSSKCNPTYPTTCSKGDLIDPIVAHCKVNCHTGPLLPIEVRSCRVRKCVPPNNSKQLRIIDVPNHLESSRCEAVEDLPVTCGFKNTRCVCDGKPDNPYFSDGCRCQYWPT